MAIKFQFFKCNDDNIIETLKSCENVFGTILRNFMFSQFSEALNNVSEENE